MRSDAADAADGEESQPQSSRTFNALRYVVGAGLLVVPMAVSPSGEYIFREPKMWLSRLEAIAIAALLARMFMTERAAFSARLTRLKPWPAIIAGATAWTFVTALLSVNRLVSTESMLWVGTFALIALGTLFVADGSDWKIAAMMLPAAVINTAIYLLQEFEVFNPFRFAPQTERHLTRSALVGNPSDVAMYLIAPAVVAAALARTKRQGRPLWIAAFVIAAIGTVATASLTGIAALTAALLVMAAMIRPRLAVIAGVAGGAVMLFAAVTYQPARERVGRAADALRSRNVDALISYRATPLIAAARMTAANPIAGVGTGAFAWSYYDYKIAIEQRFPKLAGGGAQMFNFGEAHSDHLQIAAQCGLVGYALFVVVMWTLWRRSRLAEGTAEESSVAHLVAPALVAGFAVLAIAQFPLELAAPTHAFLSAAAFAAAWSRTT